MNPPRKYTDLLVSWLGVCIVIVLVVAGGLALWAYSYTSDQVHNQLAVQRITFPAADSIYPCAPSVQAQGGFATEDCHPNYAFLKQYAGEQVTSGDQAKAYSDMILNHLNAMTGGQTYSQLSAASLAQPNNTALQGEVATVFKGTTLRGLLLNAYGFGTIATVAGWSAVALFIMAGILAILCVLGFLHAYGKIGRKEAAEPSASS